VNAHCNERARRTAEAEEEVLQEVCPTHGSVTTMWPVDISPMSILISGGAGITAFCDVVIRLEWRWHWTVYGSSFAGDELTLEEAQAKFKTDFERSHVTAKCTRCDDPHRCHTRTTSCTLAMARLADG
jgi:hypothetical protein